MIRSDRFADAELYALHRIILCIAEPHKSFALSPLHKVFQLRNLAVPKSNLSLTIPLLSTPTFRQDLQKAIRTFILNQNCLPLHIPTHKVREAPHPKVFHLLYNFKLWLRRFALKPPTTCPCASYKQLLPNQCFINGHIACPIHHLPRAPKILATCSTKSAFYPSKTLYVNTITQQTRKWCRHHSFQDVTLINNIQLLIEQHWEHHQKLIRSQHMLNHHDIKLLKSIAKDFVIQGEDHKPFKSNIFCPIKYYQALLKTWLDPTTFKVLPIEPSQLKKHLASLIPPSLSHQYPWGIDTNAQVPTGTMLLKANKQYDKGRTILSYNNTIISKLLKATSLIINHIISTVWPQCMGTAPMPIIFQQLHSFLKQLPRHDPSDPTTHFIALNDDLIGFFNALPQDRIINDLQQLIDQFCHLTHQTIDHAKLTVDLSPDAQPLHKIIPGQTNYSTKAKHNIAYHKVIHLKDIMDIVHTSFATGIVTIMQYCIAQIRGSTIGNQISPILCSIPIITKEINWQASYNEWLHNQTTHYKLWLQRYVDNRFGIIQINLTNHQAYQSFSDLEFYQHPVLLETVPDLHFLGTNVNIMKRTVRVILPEEPWQIRPPQSAGSQSSLLSGFISRLHLILKNTFPKSLIRPDVRRLINLYVQAGFPRTTLNKLTSKYITIPPEQNQFRHLPATIELRHL